MIDFDNIGNELCGIMAKEISKELDRHIIDGMIDAMFPNKDAFISFTNHMGYDSAILPDDTKISKIELYNLMELLYNTYSNYHTNSESQA